MSDSEPSAKTMALTKQQARALEKPDYIHYLQQAGLSEGRRYFELAKYSWRQHDKAELIAGAVVGILAAILFGGGTRLGTFLIGLGVFAATLILIFLIHWLRASGSFYKQALADAESAKALLEEEKNRNAKPCLVGRIICIHAETYVNTHVFHIGPPMPLDCVISINVGVTNDSTMAAWRLGSN